MACLREQTAKGYSGTFFCYETGCELGPIAAIRRAGTNEEAPETDCLLQLQLRAGRTEDSGPLERLADRTGPPQTVYRTAKPVSNFNTHRKDLVIEDGISDRGDWRSEYGRAPEPQTRDSVRLVFDQAVIESNLEIYKREELLAFSVIKRNRHRSVEPYEWFGPDTEQCDAGLACGCQGCTVRFAECTRIADREV